ncbi:hypothetical protein [Mycoplasmopsis agassizii]|uniref:ICEF-IIA n=1 Tax=Mycoplasmopsis agassizii TaxID=33922 RepID=A0ABX4H5E4_9BACT|nr:hypothetical protein [Mycoplasmopsis agassizii]PAF55117.1 hypothetical protein CJF60_00310 [Mycoplasmopsis agassizii]SMC16595.1 hypothetical protein SAMN02745179_00285 [Mycoplasmopsis agassizii]
MKLKRNIVFSILGLVSIGLISTVSISAKPPTIKKDLFDPFADYIPASTQFYNKTHQFVDTKKIEEEFVATLYTKEKNYTVIVYSDIGPESYEIGEIRDDQTSIEIEVIPAKRTINKIEIYRGRLYTAGIFLTKPFASNDEELAQKRFKEVKRDYKYTVDDARIDYIKIKMDIQKYSYQDYWTTSKLTIYQDIKISFKPLLSESVRDALVNLIDTFRNRIALGVEPSDASIYLKSRSGNKYKKLQEYFQKMLSGLKDRSKFAINYEIVQESSSTSKVNVKIGFTENKISDYVTIQNFYVDWSYGFLENKLEIEKNLIVHYKKSNWDSKLYKNEIAEKIKNKDGIEEWYSYQYPKITFSSNENKHDVLYIDDQKISVLNSVFEYDIEENLGDHEQVDLKISSEKFPDARQIIFKKYPSTGYFRYKWFGWNPSINEDQNLLITPYIGPQQNIVNKAYNPNIKPNTGLESSLYWITDDIFSHNSNIIDQTYKNLKNGGFVEVVHSRKGIVINSDVKYKYLKHKIYEEKNNWTFIEHEKIKGENNNYISSEKTHLFNLGVDDKQVQKYTMIHIGNDKSFEKLIRSKKFIPIDFSIYGKILKDYLVNKKSLKIDSLNELSYEDLMSYWTKYVTDFDPKNNVSVINGSKSSSTSKNINPDKGGFLPNNYKAPLSFNDLREIENKLRENSSNPNDPTRGIGHTDAINRLLEKNPGDTSGYIDSEYAEEIIRQVENDSKVLKFLKKKLEENNLISTDEAIRTIWEKINHINFYISDTYEPFVIEKKFPYKEIFDMDEDVFSNYFRIKGNNLNSAPFSIVFENEYEKERRTNQKFKSDLFVSELSNKIRANSKLEKFDEFISEEKLEIKYWYFISNKKIYVLVWQKSLTNFKVKNGEEFIFLERDYIDNLPVSIDNTTLYNIQIPDLNLNGINTIDGIKDEIDKHIKENIEKDLWQYFDYKIDGDINDIVNFELENGNNKYLNVKVFSKDKQQYFYASFYLYNFVFKKVNLEYKDLEKLDIENIDTNALNNVELKNQIWTKITDRLSNLNIILGTDIEIENFENLKTNENVEGVFEFKIKLIPKQKFFINSKEILVKNTISKDQNYQFDLSSLALSEIKINATTSHDAVKQIVTNLQTELDKYKLVNGKDVYLEDVNNSEYIGFLLGVNTTDTSIYLKLVSKSRNILNDKFIKITNEAVITSSSNKTVEIVSNEELNEMISKTKDGSLAEPKTQEDATSKLYWIIPITILSIISIVIISKVVHNRLKRKAV